jgi:hypothetical protein
MKDLWGYKKGFFKMCAIRCRSCNYPKNHEKRRGSLWRRARSGLLNATESARSSFQGRIERKVSRDAIIPMALKRKYITSGNHP